jgi:hypothetical protein
MATVTPASPLKRPLEESSHNSTPVKKTAPAATRWSILFVAHGEPIENVISIGMDQYRICIGNIGKPCLLATRGIGEGFAVCQRGNTEQGHAIIGLCNTSNFLPIQSVIQFLANKMILRGAVEKTIQTAIIGGMLPGSKAQEDKIWEMALVQPLSICLNVLEPPEKDEEDESEAGLAVVVAPDQILISEEDKFLLYTTATKSAPLDTEKTDTILPGIYSDDEATESDTDIHE